MKEKLEVDTIFHDDIEITDKKLREGQIKEYLLLHHAQASILCEGLLDFKEIISPSSYKKLSKEGRKQINKNFSTSRIPSPPGSSSVDLEFYRDTYQIARNDARFELAARIRRKAMEIQSGKEPRWSALVKNEIFGNLIEASRRAEGLNVFDPKQIVERIRIEDEDLWIQGKALLERMNPSLASSSKTPKPDLYIALPIIRRKLNSKGFHRDDYIQNFTLNNLASLEEINKGNLISNPLTRLDSQKPLSEKNAVCFPCAVVEVKHHLVSKGRAEECYHQVANASAAALSMLSRLSMFSVPAKSFTQIRPVVGFTFIGHNVEVWISFIKEKKYENERPQECYEMQSIWCGDLQDIWDVVQLCRIIENLHYWILMHYRPWVSSCLDRWRSVIEGDDHRSQKLFNKLVKSLKEEAELSMKEDCDDRKSEGHISTDLEERESFMNESYKEDSSEISSAESTSDDGTSDESTSEDESRRIQLPIRKSRHVSGQHNKKSRRRST